MTDLNSLVELRRMAAKIAELDRKLSGVARSSQMGYRSIEGGSIPVYDDDGLLRATIGMQPDGTTAQVAVNGPVPPTPTSPLITPVPDGLSIRWDGQFADARFAPADFSRVEVHLATAAAFTPTPETRAAALTNPAGELATIGVPGGQMRYVRLVTVSSSGISSTPSIESSGTALIPVDTQARAAADIAYTLAEGKGRVFYQPTPPTIGLDRDTWYDTSRGFLPHRWGKDERRNLWPNPSFETNLNHLTAVAGAHRTVALTRPTTGGQQGPAHARATWTRINLVTNPGAEVDVAGWTPTNGTLARVTTPVRTGTGAFALTATAANPNMAQAVAVSAGVSYLARAWVLTSVARTATLAVTFGLAGGAGNTSVSLATSTTAYGELALAFTVPAGATTATVTLSTNGAVNEIAYFDDISLVTTAVGGSLNGSTTIMPVTAQREYAYSVYVRSSRAQRVQPGLSWRGASNALISDEYGPPVDLAANTWTRLSLTRFSPAGAVSAGPIVAVDTADGVAWATGDWLDLDGLLIEQSSALGAYFDGSTAAQGNATFSWVGTAHDSASLRSTPDGWVPSPLGDLAVSGLTAGKILTGEIQAGVRLSAGPLGGTHVELTSTGLRVFVADPSDGVPNEVVRLGAGTSEEFFGVTDASGTVVANIDSRGDGSFAGLSAQGDPVFAGERLSTLLDSAGPKVVAFGEVTTSSPGTSSEVGWFEVAFNAKPNRQYRVRSNPILLRSRTSDGLAVGTGLPRSRLRVTTDGTTPALSTPTIWSDVGTAATKDGAATHHERYIVPNTGTTGMTCRMLMTIHRFGGVDTDIVDGFSSAVRRAGLMVEELGVPLQNVAVLNDGAGATVTTTKQTYTFEYEAAWTSAFRGDGSLRTDTLEGYQGYNDSNGNHRTWFGSYQRDTNGNGQNDRLLFDDVQGAEITKVEVYLYFTHWYYSAGGTAIIGYHNVAGARPTTYDGARDNVDEVRVAGWARSSGKWITMPSADNDAWRNGGIHGIVIGPGVGTDREFYGRTTGKHNNDTGKPSTAPKVRVTFTK